jgi:hypothetical protein
MGKAVKYLEGIIEFWKNVQFSMLSNNNFYQSFIQKIFCHFSTSRKNPKLHTLEVLLDMQN